jgi:hypothetical protein
MPYAEDSILGKRFKYKPKQEYDTDSEKRVYKVFIEHGGWKANSAAFWLKLEGSGVL